MKTENGKELYKIINTMVLGEDEKQEIIELLCNLDYDCNYFKNKYQELKDKAREARDLGFKIGNLL